MSQNYTWPSVSVTATNPSVGTNGQTPSATSSTLVAGQEPSGAQEPLQLDSSGNLLVNIAGSAGEINVNLNEVGGSAVSLGAKVSASSIPVVLASDEIVPISTSSLPLPTGASTSALQTSGNSSLTSILANQTNGTQVTSVSNFPATQPVSGTVAVSNFPATQPISAVSLPLPTGASTSALQTVGNNSLADIDTTVGDISAQLPATLGQKTSANSLAVVLASNQSPIQTTSSGKVAANAPVYNVYSSTNITTTAYVQLIASTTSATTFVDIFDSSGQAMILATGAMGSEVIQAYIAPGGDRLPLAIPAGTRVSYKALTANATAGYLLINLLE